MDDCDALINEAASHHLIVNDDGVSNWPFAALGGSDDLEFHNAKNPASMTGVSGTKKPAPVEDAGS